MQPHKFPKNEAEKVEPIRTGLEVALYHVLELSVLG